MQQEEPLAGCPPGVAPAGLGRTLKRGCLPGGQNPLVRSRLGRCTLQTVASPLRRSACQNRGVFQLLGHVLDRRAVFGLLGQHVLQELGELLA